MCMCVMVLGQVGWVGGDTVDRSAFWEICESHAKLDAETTVFSEFTLTALGLNTTQEVATVR